MKTPPKFQKRKVKGGCEILYKPRNEIVLHISGKKIAELEAEKMIGLFEHIWELGSVDWIRKVPRKIK